MKDKKNTWFGDVRVGEELNIDDGRIRLRVEEKSGRLARIRLDFTTETSVQKVAPTAVAFARRGVR